LIDKLNHTFPGIFEREKMVTAFDVQHGKPHPEPYLMGLAKAGVAPNEAIVVENAPMGVQAAVAAGIFTVAVNTGPLTDDCLWNRGAGLLYPDMDSLAKDWGNIMEACRFTR
jgi:beta-phosphoglucomutase-like phosphatase (HAD superfamily)